MSELTNAPHRSFAVITCHQATKLGLDPYRHYGYTVRIQPPIQPIPLTDPPTANTRQPTTPCDACGVQTPLSKLKDITSCGDWLTICQTCDRKINPPKTKHCVGWYKHRVDAERRAKVLQECQ